MSVDHPAVVASDHRRRLACAERYREIVAAVVARVPTDRRAHFRQWTQQFTDDEGDFIAGLIRDGLILTTTFDRDCAILANVLRKRAEHREIVKRLDGKREVAEIAAELAGKQVAAERVKAAADAVVAALENERSDRIFAEKCVAGASDAVVNAGAGLSEMARGLEEAHE